MALLWGSCRWVWELVILAHVLCSLAEEDRQQRFSLMQVIWKLGPVCHVGLGHLFNVMKVEIRPNRLIGSWYTGTSRMWRRWIGRLGVAMREILVRLIWWATQSIWWMLWIHCQSWLRENGSLISIPTLPQPCWVRSSHDPWMASVPWRMRC